MRLSKKEENYEFYLLIKSSNGNDILFPTNADDLTKVRDILVRRKKHTNLINVDDKWFEIQEKRDRDNNFETAVFDVTEHVLDPLTGIFKFKYFESLLNGYIEYALSNKEPFSVVMADVNGLRNINNTYGHQVGDKVLSGIGETLINSFRLKDPSSEVLEKRTRTTNPNNQKDIFTRIHGDEFVILLPNISLEDSKRKIETIKHNISDLSIDVNGIPINLASMSFGIFHVDKEYYKKGYTNPEYIAREIINYADKAMYEEKNAIKNGGDIYIFGSKPNKDNKTG